MRRALLLVVVGGLAAAGCYGHPSPDPATAPEGCAPVRILLAGDSLMGQAGQAITDRLHDLGYPVTVLNIAHGGSNVIEYGLFGGPPEFPNPRAELAHHVAEFDPAIVLVDWGVNDPWWLQGTPFETAAFWTQTAMADVRAIAGDRLVWATTVPRGDSLAGAIWSYSVNEWVKALGVPTVDWRGAVATEADTYDQFLKYREDDSVHAVRTDDGVHLTDDGIARIATWTAARLAPRACRA